MAQRFFRIVVKGLLGVATRASFGFSSQASCIEAVQGFATGEGVRTLLETPESIDILAETKYEEIVKDLCEKAVGVQDLSSKLWNLAQEMICDLEYSIYSNILLDFIAVGVNIYFIKQAWTFLLANDEECKKEKEQSETTDWGYNLFHDKLANWTFIDENEKLALKYHISLEIRQIEKVITRIAINKEKSNTHKVTSGFLFGIDLVLLLTGVASYWSTWKYLGAVAKLGSVSSTLGVGAVAVINAKSFFVDIPHIQTTLDECMLLLTTQREFLEAAEKGNRQQLVTPITVNVN